jgi:hypothetical protein
MVSPVPATFPVYHDELYIVFLPFDITAGVFSTVIGTVLIRYPLSDDRDRATGIGAVNDTRKY